jgi:anti-sigma regulatory factor (Ser/Thr protein kinase)
MCGTIGTARQASAGGHAHHAGTARQAAAPARDGPRPPGNPARIPPLADPQGNDVTGRWPLRSYLELGALPSAVPCARLHTRQLLWEWHLTGLADDAELLVSELVTNAVQITQADGRTAPVRLWLLAGRAQLLMLIWDASPLPPVPMNTSGDAENGRGLLLVETLSTRWGFFAHHSDGKVTWAVLEALVQPDARTLTTAPSQGLSIPVRAGQ